MPEDLVRGEDAWYATTWPDMPGGDGLIVRVMQGRAKKIAGNPDHPVNLGKQSARHDAAIQLTYHPDRISEPMYRQSKGGLFDPISWQRAEQLMRNAVEAGKDNMSVVTNPLGGHLEWVSINFAALNGGRHIKFDPTEQGVMQDAIRFVYQQEDPASLRHRQRQHDTFNRCRLAQHLAVVGRLLGQIRRVPLQGRAWVPDSRRTPNVDDCGECGPLATCHPRLRRPLGNEHCAGHRG